MRSTTLSLLTVTFVTLTLQACSRPAEQAATPAGDAVVTASPAIAPHAKLQACALVTPQEMSAILGSTVQGHPHEGTVDQTECIYSPADAPSPYAEFVVQWGDGASAMAAMGTMGRIEPGMTNPYAGIGDEAAQVGTALFIRTGDDLVTITFSGVGDIPVKARKIFDTAKSRM